MFDIEQRLQVHADFKTDKLRMQTRVLELCCSQHGGQTEQRYVILWNRNLQANRATGALQQRLNQQLQLQCTGFKTSRGIALA